MKRLTLAVDFDGTIVEEGFPSIGAIKPRTLEFMKQAYDKGHLVIVWTARSGEFLEQARAFLFENNIPFHYINENPEDPYFIAGNQGRKIFAHYYLDDRAVHVNDLENLFAEL